MSKKTIKELAEEIGVSKTAINNNVTPIMREQFFSKVGNRFEINEEGQDVIKAMFTEDIIKNENSETKPQTSQTKSEKITNKSKTTQTKPKLTTTESKTSETSQTDTYLKNELPEKAMAIIENYQDQIKEKDQQLAELHNLLNQQQQLTLQSNQHIQQLQLELSKDNEDNSSPSETERSSFTDNEVKTEENKKEAKKGFFSRLFNKL
uniref:DUF536 domain-containing protein n=1 Tax=Carnobacterium sp. TaxID=48221 RepID=UPI00159AFCCE|nr:DUF536 domain-containing protein [Carnobacterium sp.]QJS06090.1 Repb-like protein [Carnobacterium sp.]